MKISIPSALPLGRIHARRSAVQDLEDMFRPVQIQADTSHYTQQISTWARIERIPNGNPATRRVQRCMLCRPDVPIIPELSGSERQGELHIGTRRLVTAKQKGATSQPGLCAVPAKKRFDVPGRLHCLVGLPTDFCEEGLHRETTERTAEAGCQASRGLFSLRPSARIVPSSPHEEDLQSLPCSTSWGASCGEGLSPVLLLLDVSYAEMTRMYQRCDVLREVHGIVRE